MMRTAFDFSLVVVAVARREPVQWRCFASRPARRRLSSPQRIPCFDSELWKPCSA